MSEEAIDPKELQLSIREVLEAEAPSEHVHKLYGSDALIDESLAKTAAGLGWYALAVSEEKGGLGLGLRGLAVLYEELGRIPAALPILSTMLAAEAIEAAGADTAQEQWLVPLLGGEAHAAWISFEPGLAFVGGKLTGTARFVVDGATADLFLVSVEDGAVLIPRDSAGVSIEPSRLVDRTRSLAHVSFEGVAGEWLAIPSDRLHRHALLGIAWDSVGGAASILERTIEYMKVRTQFGQPIGSFQALKHRIADHKLRLETALGMAREATALAADDPRALAFAALAKTTAADSYAAIADDAVQLHGGIGFTWEQDSHIFLKRARLNQILYGAPEDLLDLAAQHMTEIA